MTTTSARPSRREASGSLGGLVRGDHPVGLVLRLIAVAGLAIDAWVHLSLADQYRPVGGTIDQGLLFDLEGIAAIVVGGWLLVRGSWPAWIATFLLGAAGVGAVVLYRYVDVGAIGPIPNMYEPVWYFRKTLSAYAEAWTALAAVLWAGFTLARRKSAS